MLDIELRCALYSILVNALSIRELHHPDAEANACQELVPEAGKGTASLGVQSEDWKPFDGHQGQVCAAVYLMHFMGSS